MTTQYKRNVIYLIMIASLLAGLLTGKPFFFSIAYLLGILLFVAFVWSWFAVRWISIRRRTRTRRTQVGGILEEVFVIRNTSIIPKLWIEIRDHSDLPRHNASQVVSAMNGRGRQSWNIQTQCLVRGEFKLGPITLISGDPFGLFTAPRVIPASSRIIVYPETFDIPKFELPIGNTSGGEAQRRRTHYITTNAAGVRDYVAGDSFNRIHWKSTARKNRLIVKEFEIDPLVDIWLFVDFSAESLVEPYVERRGQFGPIVPRFPGVPPSTEEYAVVVAASLAQYFIRRERAVGFAAYTPKREIHEPERGNRQMTHIFESLAVARSRSNYSLSQMLSLETPYFTRGTTLIVITSSLDTNWIAEAQVLSRRGIKPLAIFIDPYTFGGSSQSDKIKGQLQLSSVPSIIINNGDDLVSALSSKAY